MNLQFAIAALGIILDLAENIITNATAKKIIKLAETVLPILIQDAADEVPVVMQILGLLKKNAPLEPADIATIDDMISKADIDVDNAVADFNKRAHPNG